MRIKFAQNIIDICRGKKKNDSEFLQVTNEYPIRLTQKEKQFLIKHINANCENYLEFGSGGSTFLALLHSDLRNVVSIESDNNWLNHLREWNVIKEAENNKKLFFKHINIGKTGAWGIPADDSHRELFPNYSKQIFAEKIFDNDYDVVFIDGRFRVACALQTILNCSKETKIIIHDFCNREEYHVLLKYLEIVELIDTICLFKVRENINKDQILKTYEEYKYIFD